MKIAVFGEIGQVATELQRQTPKGVDLITVDRDSAEFLAPDQVYNAAMALRADAIINAVGYTAVDKAEEERSQSDAVNGASVGALAQACAEKEIPLVHISTDYVFDGRGDAPQQPDNATNPLGQYGRSKLLGETLIRENNARHAILRTSWVFSAHGANFVKSMLRLGVEHEKLTIVSDQIGGPTPAVAIADALFTVASSMADGHPGGTYHFAGEPDASWADFAREIFQQANLATCVIGIPTTDYPTPAQRPLNSRLDCESLLRDFGIARPDWRAGLSDVLKELQAK
ncbi:MAG: dTDP-4-dehydrorhamnose reductase [Boseongicola sp.]